MSFIEDYHSDQVEFYATLGHAITQWASVERALFLLYWHTMGEPTSAAPVAAYFSVINFSAKLSMVDNAMIARYRNHPDILKTWAPIKNWVGKRAKDRNELAHNQLVIDARVEGAMSHCLVPLMFNPNPALRGKNPKLTTEQIADLAIKFNQAARRLDDFWERLQLTPLPESP